jgi:membrane-bound metal-dependent hydrolase YbcI (DUF457 family)
MRGAQASAGEVLGSLISSLLASSLPDILEPADHANHRSTFHSKGFLALVTLVAWPALDAKRREQLDLAAVCAEQEALCVLAEHKEYWRQQAAWHQFLAGLWGGGAPGYTSHLLADAQTPKGLPLFG